jgi:hypothetical protein
MALDPNDPLIPMPWQMDSIRAYRASRTMQAEEDALKMEKLRMDISKAREEETMSTPIGRAGRAADVAAFLEQEKQKESGIPIGEEIGARMIAKGGPSILEATKMQGQLDVEARARQARVDAAKNYLAGEKSLLPTANVDLGGVKQTVLASEAGRTSADIYKQVFTNQTPQLAEGYIARGYDRDTAIKMAAADVQDMLVKERSSGKVTLMSADGLTSRAISDKEAMMMWRDPKTPKVIREQLNQIYGQSEEPQAASWIKTRLGR